ncbi:MAG: TIGR02206 family membrane protein [Rhodothermia bacterium]|nr:TIGR02206 family membrane protein [Rhodothermia bacterium]
MESGFEEYWAIDHPLGPFELFGGAHLIALAVVAAVSIVMFAYGERLSSRSRRRVRYGFAAVLVVNEALWHLWALLTDQYTIQRMLPLHLCSAMVWFSAVVLLVNARRLFGVIYFLGIAGAVQALITPDAGLYGFPHFRFVQTMISHSGVFLAGVYVVAVEGYRPTLRTALYVLAGLNVYAAVVGVINWQLGSNYLFVSGKPDSASLLDAMPEWPWYIPILEVFAVVLLVGLWLPFRRSGDPTPHLIHDGG